MIQLEFVRLIETCPKCSGRLTVGSSECSNCGVLIPKVLAQIEEPLQADFRREFGADFTYRWQSVVADYENEDAHWAFINHCRQFNALEFAAYRYRRLIDVVRDDIAIAMLKRVEALAQVEMMEQALVRKSQVGNELVAWPRALVALVCLVGGMALFLEPVSGAIFLVGLALLRAAFMFHNSVRLPEEQEINDFFNWITGGKPEST